jgi:hypothetical protein
LYGSDAIGGVINIFTKKGEGPTRVSASTGYGSYGTSISDASIYGSTGGDKNTSYSVSATTENRDFNLSTLQCGHKLFIDFIVAAVLIPNDFYYHQNSPRPTIILLQAHKAAHDSMSHDYRFVLLIKRGLLDCFLRKAHLYFERPFTGASQLNE